MKSSLVLTMSDDGSKENDLAKHPWWPGTVWGFAQVMVLQPHLQVKSEEPLH